MREQHFATNKAALREEMTFVHDDFVFNGGVVTVGKPAFAMGCETPSVVRQAILAERK